MKAAVIGRAKNISGDPSDIMRLCRRVVSVGSPSTSATIMGASGRRYLPYLVTLFFFILAMNLAGVFPGANIAGTSVVAIPLILAIIS